MYFKENGQSLTAKGQVRRRFGSFRVGLIKPMEEMMIGESFIITGLLLIAAASFFRSKRKKWAVATLPLTVLPAVNALVGFVSTVLLKVRLGFVTEVCIIMGALIVSCTWTGFLTATLLNRRKARIPYMIGCVAFDIALAAVFMGYYYSVLEL